MKHLTKDYLKHIFENFMKHKNRLYHLYSEKQGMFIVGTVHGIKRTEKKEDIKLTLAGTYSTEPMIDGQYSRPVVVDPEIVVYLVDEKCSYSL